LAAHRFSYPSPIFPPPYPLTETQGHDVLAVRGPSPPIFFFTNRDCCPYSFFDLPPQRHSEPRFGFPSPFFVCSSIPIIVIHTPFFGRRFASRPLGFPPKVYNVELATKHLFLFHFFYLPHVVCFFCSLFSCTSRIMYPFLCFTKRPYSVFFSSKFF